MLIKREVLIKTGGFDERFFMYGEDIDLCLRIKQCGYKNVYFAEETIVHFKGRSSNKGSIKYSRMFYGAMIIFVEKYYKGRWGGVLALFLKTAILSRAIPALIANATKSYTLKRDYQS